MSEINTQTKQYTPEQQRAIDAKGKTIVSASAGSGKTTVMIEKIIKLLISDKEKVSNILAVTFTKKAASQMKEKLRKALIDKMNDASTEPAQKENLKVQLQELPSADISTIHSFCSKLIRSHFYVAGVDNAFRVINGDDAEGTAMQNSALDELLEEGYEQGEEDFARLLSTYWRKKSDTSLRKIFLSAYKKLRNRADYKEYLAGSGSYTEQTFECVCQDLLSLLHEKARYYLEQVEDERSYFEGIEHASASLTLSQELAESLEKILATEEYFSACALEKIKFTAKQRANKKDTPEFRLHVERLAELKEKIAKIYNKELAETLSKKEELDNFLLSGDTAKALGKYLLRFDEKYAQLKAERGALDYNDLEHIALALLKNPEVAQETREKYKHVFVDEYQDVNPVQEEIVSLIGGTNLFLVGDVKQAIYGFRGSKSEYFVKTQNEFAQGAGNALYMTNNFRSSDAVLDAVNAQFSLAMTPKTSSVDYKNDSFMQRGNGYLEGDGRVQIHFLPEPPKAEKRERGVYSVRERANANEDEAEESLSATAIYQIIQEELSKKWYDAEKKEPKQVKYSDIAILSRKKQGQISKTVAALSAKGVPVTSASAVNICEFSEIKTLIDWFLLIDNAEQDVPLCSALLSTTENLTFNELADIRLAYKEEGFFRVACQKYAKEKEDAIAHKLRRFYAYYQELKRFSTLLTAGEMLTKIISQTRMEARLLEMDNGVACLKRMHRFVEETSNPEPLSVHAFLERLRDLSYKIEYSENGGEDSVKVLTMHSSKGLEYPVVIIDDLNAPFRGADHDELLLEEKYGLAPRAFDDKKMTKSSTLLRRLCAYKQVEESIKDELNLYYVALTRAKYALHLIFKKKTLVSDVRYAHSFADFTDFSVWEKYVVSDDFTIIEKPKRTMMLFEPDKDLEERIQRAFLWEYEHTGYESLPVKSSATQLMESYESKSYALQETSADGEAIDEEFENLTEELSGTDAQTGIAYHAFLEGFDFKNLYDSTGERLKGNALSDTVLQSLLQMRKTDEENANLLSLEKLVEILSNEVFDGLRDKKLYKEQQFLVSLPVKDTYGKKKGENAELLARDSGEEMLFQGAIDLFVAGENTAQIIDYKYSRKDGEKLVERYKPQLDLYRLAVAKIMKIPFENVRCTLVNIYHGFQVEVE